MFVGLFYRIKKIKETIDDGTPNDLYSAQRLTVMGWVPIGPLRILEEEALEDINNYKRLQGEHNGR